MARLPRVMGRGRALEVLLSADDISGADAERLGYVNGALPDAELDNFVDALATRIASFDAWAIANTKRLVNDASLPPDVEIRAGWDACMASVKRPNRRRNESPRFWSKDSSNPATCKIDSGSTWDSWASRTSAESEPSRSLFWKDAHDHGPAHHRQEHGVPGRVRGRRSAVTAGVRGHGASAPRHLPPPSWPTKGISSGSGGGPSHRRDQGPRPVPRRQPSAARRSTRRSAAVRLDARDGHAARAPSQRPGRLGRPSGGDSRQAMSDRLPDPRLTLVYRLEATLAPPLDLGEIAQGHRRIVP